jgi:CBS domain containing-hemolysin-like protein
MVPRIDVAALSVTASIDEAVAVFVEKGFSRLPIYEESVDNIVGVLYAKDFLPFLLMGERPESLREVARPPYFIPEGKKVDELLTELRQTKVHIAIVVDEYGGTAGIVTVEDLLEEIVGEIEDEYDVASTPIERLGEDEVVVDARVTVDALNELFDVNIEDEDYDTVGGLVYHILGKMPGAGDSLSVDGLDLQVVSVMGRRIKKVRVSRRAEPAPTAPPGK